MCVHCFLSSLQYVLSFQLFLRRFAFQVAIYVLLILLHSVIQFIGFFVPMSWFLRFTLCSFDFASTFHALVDCAAVPFSWIDDALMLLYSANVGMNISRNEVEKLNRGNGAKCTMFVKFSKEIAET